ncbi:MBL fold metallo-hydrolase [bacterium]|nr:MBL fold metallo-hydrolase [bacterium]
MKRDASDGIRLSFHGAAGTVTGSRHLLEAAGRRVLFDCGLFQGLKELRLRNWAAPGFEPGFLHDLVLTHAHIDHTGWTPRLMQYRFKGAIHATPPTAELLELVLMDAARLQEEDAAFANKKGFSKHQPAEPLYTEMEALAALKLVRSTQYGKWRVLSPAVRFRYRNAGHILGSAFVEVRVGGAQAPRDGVNPGELTIVFGGDLGRYGVPLHVDPDPLPPCDVLVVESTYGNKKHEYLPVLEQIRAEFKRTVHKRGVVLIPAFAVGRTQAIALILRELMEEGDLAEVPIHIDSPMAIDATAIYSRHLGDGNLDPGLGAGGSLFPRQVHLHRTVHESKMLTAMDGPRVIIASSGMMTGGRILHHLVRHLPNPRNLVLLSGYQALGTRGRQLQDGARHLRMHGQDVAVGARVGAIEGLSSHADADEIMRWVGTCRRPPRRVFVVHGEGDGPAALKARLEAALPGVEVAVPAHGDGFDLDR